MAYSCTYFLCFYEGGLQHVIFSNYSKLANEVAQVGQPLYIGTAQKVVLPLTLSVKKRLKPKLHLFLFIRDAACPAELLQPFVSIFGLNQHLQFLPTQKVKALMQANGISVDRQNGLRRCGGPMGVFLRSITPLRRV